MLCFGIIFRQRWYGSLMASGFTWRLCRSTLRNLTIESAYTYARGSGFRWRKSTSLTFLEYLSTNVSEGKKRSESRGAITSPYSAWVERERSDMKTEEVESSRGHYIAESDLHGSAGGSHSDQSR
ncbi:hypothetical protein M378DRAFT_808036 [Amanita muscaria Koide BX008]|uniref:Uncharacterized protein n=1 Tax=Amanita muscaria (strain Koide BX008) TaxID=946122 RepID=A0A0C2X054_AMAMK|nr:hypothetical protein M378DRAFT_808036 [Amanita muscaria Koide BX008]